MNKYWISWYGKIELGPYELHSPWWISGQRCSDDADTVVAAVIAENEEQAQEIIYLAYDTRPASLEFRFISERASDWSPFSGRFPKADWMQWPETVLVA